MIPSKSRGIGGATAVVFTCLATAGSAWATGSVTGSATFENPTCTKAGRQISVTIMDSSTQGGASYTLVANNGAVTPNSATVFQGGSWNKVVSVSSSATKLYVYADGQMVGQTSFAACDSSASSTSSPSSTTASSPSTATSSTKSAPSTTTSPSTTAALATTTHQATVTPEPTTTSATAPVTHHSTTAPTPSTPADQIVPGPAPTSSVQPAPKTNPQGSAGPLKWGVAIALILGGGALAAVYFRREFKR